MYKRTTQALGETTKSFILVQKHLILLAKLLKVIPPVPGLVFELHPHKSCDAVHKLPRKRSILGVVFNLNHKPTQDVVHS